MEIIRTILEYMLAIIFHSLLALGVVSLAYFLILKVIKDKDINYQAYSLCCNLYKNLGIGFMVVGLVGIMLSDFDSLKFGALMGISVLGGGLILLGSWFDPNYLDKEDLRYMKNHFKKKNKIKNGKRKIKKKK